jgi:hypothetical protein
VGRDVCEVQLDDRLLVDEVGVKDLGVASFLELQDLDLLDFPEGASEY